MLLPLVSKAPPALLRKVLPSLITHQQTAYVQNKCISETGDFWHSKNQSIRDFKKLKGYLVTIDIEQAWLSKSFLSYGSPPKKFGFGLSFVINAGTKQCI